MRLQFWAWAHLSFTFPGASAEPEGIDKNVGAEEERHMGDTVGFSPGQNQPLSCA